MVLLRPPAGPELLLAAGLTVAGQIEVVLAGDSVEGSLVLQHVGFALMTAPVALRRVAPLPAVLVCALGLLTQTVAGPAPVASGFVGALVLLASLGYHAPLRAGVFGVGALLLAGGSYELLHQQVVLGDLLVNVLIMVGVWFLAHRVRLSTDARVEAELARDRATREAVLAERTRISRDLHDSVAHALTVMTLHAGAAREAVDAGPAAAALDAIGDAGREALVDMHRFLRLLGGDGAPESPGLSDLQRVVTTAEGAGLRVSMETRGDVTAVPASVGATGYRVVQEALTNILRHSDAQSARVRVEVDRNALHIDVVDEGTAAARLGAGSGRGLAGLRERVELFGGRLTAEPGSNGGWQLSVWLPLGAPAA